MTAVSLHAYAYLLDKYVLCPCGASMGDRYGPMVVAREPMTIGDLADVAVAVPGTLTTAYPGAAAAAPATSSRTVVVPFDQILDAVEAGEYQGQPVDAGLIIHEGQLTFGERGLQLVVDLGVWWQDETGLPLPLGGNVVRKDLGPRRSATSAGCSSESIHYALDHRDEALDYALQYGRDMDRDAGGPVRRHVRQRLDARLRPPRPRGGQATAGPRARSGSDSAPGGAGVFGVGIPLECGATRRRFGIFAITLMRPLATHPKSKSGDESHALQHRDTHAAAFRDRAEAASPRCGAPRGPTT